MRNRFVILAVTLALLVTLCHEAGAQGPAIEVASQGSITVGGNLLFSVKFLCGTINVSPGLPLAAGRYLTAINIHNLSASRTNIVYSVNGALLFDFAMAARSVQRFDCRNIVSGSFFPSAFLPADPFSEGFVTLSAVENKGRQLKVVAVYTVATVPQ